MDKKEIKIYSKENGSSPFLDWLKSLDKKSRERVQVRIDRILDGNFGDFKQIDNEINELRFHFSSGYRVYFAQDGEFIVLLLCGGDKSSQSKDIKKAKEYYLDYMESK